MRVALSLSNSLSQTDHILVSLDLQSNVVALMVGGLGSVVHSKQHSSSSSITPHKIADFQQNDGTCTSLARSRACLRVIVHIGMLGLVWMDGALA